MEIGRVVYLIVVLVSVSRFAQTAYAIPNRHDQKEVDEAIKSFLSSQSSERESAESQDTAVADLNGDGKAEIVLVWTLMGPTYWRNTLTVFSKTSTGYKSVASLPLNGEAKLTSTKGGIILIDQKVFAKNDPLCCPSVKKLGKYRWMGKRIIEVKKRS